MPAPDIDMIPEVSSDSTDSACLDLWEKEEWETSHTNINASTHDIMFLGITNKKGIVWNLCSAHSQMQLRQATFDLKTIYTIYCLFFKCR